MIGAKVGIHSDPIVHGYDTPELTEVKNSQIA
jgi:hypothetical protein